MTDQGAMTGQGALTFYFSLGVDNAGGARVGTDSVVTMDTELQPAGTCKALAKVFFILGLVFLANNNLFALFVAVANIWWVLIKMTNLEFTVY